jgi:hypothetical protein
MYANPEGESKPIRMGEPAATSVIIIMIQGKASIIGGKELEQQNELLLLEIAQSDIPALYDLAYMV